MPTTRLRATLTASTLTAATILALVDATGASAAPQAAAAAAPPGGSMVPIAPVRILDSRSSSPGGLLHGTVDPTRAMPGVPAGDIAAVLINVTVVNARSAGYIRVGESAGTSNGNFVAGKPSATLALVPLSHSTALANYVPFEASTPVSVIADVQGYVTTPAAATTSTFTSTGPTRAADSRTSAGLVRFAPAGTQLLDVRKRASLPANATAVVANVTIVKATAATYVTAYPSGIGRPTASTVNAAAGATVANRVVVPLGSDGRIALYNFAGRSDVLVDVVGYLSPSADGSYYTPATVVTRIADHAGERQTLTPDVPGTSDLTTTAVWVSLAAASNAPGYLVAAPTVTLPSRTSDLNLVAGRAVANSGPVALTSTGSFTVASAPTSRFVVDLDGFFQKA